MKNTITGLFILAAMFTSTLVNAADTSRADRMMQKLDARFTQADVNGDGQVTEAEAKDNMPFVSRHFSEIDADKNGGVTLEEIQKYAASRKRGVAAP